MFIRGLKIRRFVFLLLILVTLIGCGGLTNKISTQVSIENQSSNIQLIFGRVIDPPIVGATVFCDKNNNYLPDSNELSTITVATTNIDEIGTFLMQGSCPLGTMIHAINGLDEITNAPNIILSTQVRTNELNKIIISPVSTILSTTDESSLDVLTTKLIASSLNANELLNLDYHKECSETNPTACRLGQINISFGSLVNTSIETIKAIDPSNGIPTGGILRNVIQGISKSVSNAPSTDGPIQLNNSSFIKSVILNSVSEINQDENYSFLSLSIDDEDASAISEKSNESLTIIHNFDMTKINDHTLNNSIENLHLMNQGITKLINNQMTKDQFVQNDFKSCSNDQNNNGLCDDIEISGCTTNTACNYNPDASLDDGSCLIIESTCDRCNPNGSSIIDGDLDNDGVCSEFDCDDNNASIILDKNLDIDCDQVIDSIDCNNTNDTIGECSANEVCNLSTFTCNCAPGTVPSTGGCTPISSPVSPPAFNIDQFGWVKLKVTYNEAKLLAENKGGQLAVIESESENTAVFNKFNPIFDNIPNKIALGFDIDSGAIYVWLGGSDSVQEGHWTWVSDQLFYYKPNDTTLIYANWGNQNNATEPDNYNSNQHSLGLAFQSWPIDSNTPYGSPGQWNDIKSDNLLGFIVECLGTTIWNDDTANCE